MASLSCARHSLLHRLRESCGGWKLLQCLVPVRFVCKDFISMSYHSMCDGGDGEIDSSC